MRVRALGALLACPSRRQLPSPSRVRCGRAREETAQQLPERSGPLTRKVTVHPELLTCGQIVVALFGASAGRMLEASRREPLAWSFVVERVTRIEDTA